MGPTIILWTCHDLGTAVNPYGDHSVPTPQLQRLADSGLTFTRNFCTTPLCSPSRGSIQTGRYPHVNGLIGLVNQGWDLPASERCLVNHLADAGYETHLLGFQHIRADTASLGFDHHEPAATRARVAGERVAALLAEPSERPRYLEVNTGEAHRPWAEDDGSVDPGAVAVPPFWPDTPEVRGDLAGLYRHILAVDEGVGRVLDALEGRDDVLFVFTTDHGIAFPRCKSTLYDSGLRTALMIRFDGGTARGRKVDSLVSNIDLCPTLLDLAGVARPRGLDGRSFRAQVGGSHEPHRQWIFAEKSWHDDDDPLRCVRTERWKYIHNLRPGPLLTLALDMIPANCATARSLHNSYLAERPEEELYDVQEDPHELRNLAADPTLKSTLEDLRGMVDEWMRQTDDPFLEHGYVPGPARNYAASMRGRQWWSGA